MMDRRTSGEVEMRGLALACCIYVLGPMLVLLTVVAIVVIAASEGARTPRLTVPQKGLAVQTTVPQEELRPEFRLGFKALADQIPNIVGEPAGWEEYSADGDSIQVTTTGLMAWRKAHNWTTFTDGATTWIGGPEGLHRRGNDERFGWEWEEGWPTPAPTATPVPSPTPVPVVGTVTIDGKQYLTNLRLAALAEDPYLRGAIAYAYNHAPDWRPLADAAARRGTAIRFGALGEGLRGEYSGRNNVITVDAGLRRELTGAVAAVLAHEVYHAYVAPFPGAAGKGARECLQEEIIAFAWGAYVWSQVPRGRSTTSLERELDAVLRYWGRQELDDYVVTTKGYQVQCLGGVLRSP